MIFASYSLFQSDFQLWDLEKNHCLRFCKGRTNYGSSGVVVDWNNLGRSVTIPYNVLACRSEKFRSINSKK
jgi:hypothetical protein